MIALQDTKTARTPRAVLRGVNGQNSNNEVGLHWLRISIPHQYLKPVRSYCDGYFGDSSQDGYGLWSYDTRYSWPNKASLNYDSDFDRAALVHNGKVTLDIPGQALDVIAQDRLHIFLAGFRYFNPVCTRCDIFFDDFQRVITPEELSRIARKGDYGRFRKFQIKERGFVMNHEYIPLHSEIDFGSRGENGSGKFLRVYDKSLESEGEKNCIRWEIEFSKERSHMVFDKLSQVSSVEAFATLCGSLVGGAIVFVHRDSDRKLDRLRIYNFWEQIKKTLGSLIVRVEKTRPDIDGLHKYIYLQVSPTMATLRRTFVDEIDFYNWLFDVLDEGELRMSQRQINLAKLNKRKIRYRDGKVFDDEGVLVA